MYVLMYVKFDCIIKLLIDFDLWRIYVLLNIIWFVFCDDLMSGVNLLSLR